MPETRTTQLARAYGVGEATVDEVIASARRGAREYAAAQQSADEAAGTTYEERLRDWQNDGAGSLVEDGWNGVVIAYVADYLNDTQFDTLHAAYLFSPAGK